ncbi:MAG: hypothetical protein ACXQTZ_03630 [Candidatus Alkanophagales archaeon]
MSFDGRRPCDAKYRLLGNLAGCVRRALLESRHHLDCKSVNATPRLPECIVRINGDTS